MSIAQEIAALADKASRSLDALSDYCEHIEAFWRSHDYLVEHGFTQVVHNVQTGNSVNEIELAALTEQYRTQYLLAFSFQHLTSLFESFLFDLLKTILINNPIQLSQDKQFRVREAPALPDRAALVEFFVEQELLAQAYRRPRDWFDYLNRLVNVGCPTPDEIEMFAEIKSCRDVLMHNAGVVNATYIEKAGAKAKWQLGESIVIEPPYFQDCWRLIRKLINDLSTGLQARLPPP